MTPAKKIARYGLLLAVTLTLAFIEGLFPPPPMLPPGVKFGLSNIVVMYGVFHLGKLPAFVLAILKSLFVLTTRGPVAGLLSLCGGMLAVGAVVLLLAFFRDKVSYAAAGVTGACCHNLGQYAAVSVLLGSPDYLIYYFPILLLAGLVAGMVTGTLLKIVLPTLRR